MKRTFIALIALAGVASAETVIFNIGGSNVTSSNEDVSIVGGALGNGESVSKTATLDESSITLKFQNGTGVARKDNTTAADNWTTSLGMPETINLGIEDTEIASLLSSSAQIEAGHTKDGAYGGISTFTLTGLQTGRYELVSFMGRASGSATNTTLTLSGATNVSVTSYVYSNGAWTLADSPTLGYAASGVSSAMVNVYNFDATTGSNVVLTYTGSVSYNGTPGQNTDIPTYQNVQFVAVKSIPEPTTATLSLLALAGLAARRRRK